MKNSLNDLNNILFEQLERLNDDEIMDKDSSARKEIDRAKAICTVSGQIISNASTILQAVELQGTLSLNCPDVLNINKTKRLEAKI